MLHPVGPGAHLVSKFFLFVCTASLLMLAPGTGHAQPDSIMVVTGEAVTDTAGVALGLARGFQASGQDEQAIALLQVIIERYPHTPAAQEAEELLASYRKIRTVGRGETQFIVWNTLFATWLGLAIPIAVGADEASTFGATLLLAPPAGFFLSRAYTKARPISLGQSGAYLWATVWASWQALGWRAVLEIGNHEDCYDYGFGLECVSRPPENAEVKALLVGGVIGIGSGLILANQNIAAGDATLATHASLWGTFYGLAIGGMADLSDDDLLTAALVAGNLGLIAAIPGGRAWKPARGQIWVVSAAGIAGGVAGVGIDLLVQPEATDVAIGIPTLSATLGLVLGSVLTKNTKWRDEASIEPWNDSLLSLNHGAELGFPLPQPGTVTTFDTKARRKLVPSWEIKLVQASF